MRDRDYEVAPRGGRTGALLLALAALSAIACVALLWGARHDLLRLSAAALCASVTVSLARRGRQQRIPVLRDVAAVRSLARRSGIPVALYLRRFADDPAADHPAAEDSTLDDADEAQLALALSELCLLVAIGRPGEPLPPWGAYRLYVAGDDWKREVAALLSIASIVVVRCAPSEALQWELAQIQAAGMLQRTLFLLPAADAGDQDPRRWLPPRTRVEMPALSNSRHYAAFVTVDANGVARVHPRDLKLGYGAAAAQVVATALQLQPLGHHGRQVMRGFYRRAERLLPLLPTLALYGTFGGMALAMSVLLLLLPLTLFAPSRVLDAVLDAAWPVLGPLFIGTGIVVAVSLGLLLAMAALRDRLCP